MKGGISFVAVLAIVSVITLGVGMITGHMALVVVGIAGLAVSATPLIVKAAVKLDMWLNPPPRKDYGDKADRPMKLPSSWWWGG